MGDAARKIVVEESRLRRVLGRWLAPGIVKTALEELRDEPEIKQAEAVDPERVERARALARMEAKR